QAEDGIRDGHVTGVQTCALPIYQQVLMSLLLELAQEAHQDLLISDRVRGLVTMRIQGESADVALAGVLKAHSARLERVGEVGVRSEERRVGKECRELWAWGGGSR